MDIGGSIASADSSDSSFVNNSIGLIGDVSNAYSDNVSFNRGSISAYSAEELVIQQRGRRTPLKRAHNDLHQIQQKPIRHHKINSRVAKDLFRRLRQSSMQSPDTKYCHSQNNHSSDTNQEDILNNSNLINSSTSSTETSSCKRKSLLRTPVKRRLRFRRTTRKANLFQR